MMKKLIAASFCILVFAVSSMHAQIYETHFGMGNTVGVTVTSSSEQGVDESRHTLNGTGYIPDLKGAARLLGQASIGSTYEEIEYLTQISIENWIDQQMAMPAIPYIDKALTLYDEVNQLIENVHPGQRTDRPGEISSFALYNSLFNDQDVLRNKIAFSLLQVLVVSRSSIKLKDQLPAHMSYYDLLYEGAFGNYRDMLEDITLHPMMGYYLSHLNNKKGDPSLGTLPDENFAREIMQLFTIGLHELKIDGTYKLDGNGEKIPTYNISDVQELAKVFTGLSGGAWNLISFPDLAGQPVEFDRAFNRYDLTVPMAMYQDFHDIGEKILVDGTVLPAGQDGMTDIQTALDVLFNHPNMGPFLATRLIQQMVKSNPTPAYVKRVALTFNNNGKGVRGDLGAMIKAILLDPEARDCSWLNNAKNGKLKQPIERLVQLFKAFDINSPSGRVWFNDPDQIREPLGQAFMSAPSVFNFFTPFYAEDKYVEPNNMVSPEFQILHAVTVINYINEIENSIKDRPFRNRTGVNNNNPRLNYNNQDNPVLDFSEELAILQSEGLEGLMERLNILLCQGQMSDATKSIILGALQQMLDEGGFSPQDYVDTALYFTIVSPDYIILE